MLIAPQIMIQQNNIYKNRKLTVTLPYSEEMVFYKRLDQEIESGKKVKITFPDEKMTEGSGLHKRISSCSNGVDFFEQMAELAKTAFEAYKHFASKNIFGLLKTVMRLAQKQIYMAYEVNYSCDKSKGKYFLLLKPVGKGNNSKEWMYLL